MNSSLDSLFKNLSDNVFKNLYKEFSGKYLELVKQKGVYPYEYFDSFQKFSKNKLPDISKFFSSLKDNVSIKKQLVIKQFLFNSRYCIISECV